jgi:hypothetical protein
MVRRDEYPALFFSVGGALRRMGCFTGWSAPGAMECAEQERFETALATAAYSPQSSNNILSIGRAALHMAWKKGELGLHGRGRPLTMLRRCTLRADTICCFVELAINFFVQSFMPPCCAITFDSPAGANIGMAFRSVVTHTDSYICVERANRSCTGSLKRVTHSRSEIICVAVDGHQSLLL